MPLSPERSLHHLEADSLETLEREVLKMNLILDKSIEVFQVQKIGDKWFAFFNVDSLHFKKYSDGVLKLNKRGNATSEVE